MQSEISSLSEVPFEKQIQSLLLSARIEEAWQVFSIKEGKNPQFEQKRKHFELDAAWILFLKRIDFHEAMKHF